MSDALIKSVAVVSEVSVGYGSPQTLSMAGSFAQRFDATVALFEPDQPERPPLVGLAPKGVSITRQYTAVHPYSPPGKIEYCRAVADEINRSKPDIVVIVSFLGLPILPMLTYRPWAVLFYALEHTNGKSSPDLDLLRRWRDDVDLFLFCDADRASLDGGRIGIGPAETHIVLNGSAQAFSVRESDARNGRLFYGGLISPDHTNADYFLNPAVRRYPIDLFGIFDGQMTAEDFNKDAEQYPNGVRYGGYLAASFAFGDLLPRYCYSIVMWAPRDEATRLAAPNKFFEAIAAGVPPISTPHPQCKAIIERFKLGVLIDDWSAGAFGGALALADGIFQTDLYDEMVANCLKAHDQFLSWDRQFDHLESLLRSAQRQNVRRLRHGLPGAKERMKAKG